jgi:hypothetical protein
VSKVEPCDMCALEGNLGAERYQRARVQVDTFNFTWRVHMFSKISRLLYDAYTQINLRLQMEMSWNEETAQQTIDQALIYLAAIWLNGKSKVPKWDHR